MRRWMNNQWWLIIIVLFMWWGRATPVQALDNHQHSTIIINQVRGNECCGHGSFASWQNLLQSVQKNHLAATWVIRYDALQDPQYVAALQKLRGTNQEIGAFLEITPALATASGVVYPGSTTTWYEARQAYLLGYPPAVRQQIIDTYMAAFHQALGFYPTTTTAWMIDTASLRYLHDRYGITVHEITREQWGTDSYTLDGGPPVSAYYPSANWAFVPTASQSGEMPLMVRQTISDPVYNYGDTTNSYTSQPNDYALGQRSIAYFQHLFNQAHTPPAPADTVTILGLENSMGAAAEQEFDRQMTVVARWQHPPQNMVVTAAAYAAARTTISLPPVQLTAGQDEKDPAEQAWWLTTDHYRLRLRLSAGELFISDIRLYDDQLTDPYNSTASGRLAYWVTPYLLDGSRWWANDTSGHWDRLDNDSLSQRRITNTAPTRWTLRTAVAADQLVWQTTATGEMVLNYQQQPLAIFAPNSWQLASTTAQTANTVLDPIITNHQWHNSGGQAIWGVQTTTANPLTTYQPFIQATAWEEERRARHPLLWPELQNWPLSTTHSFLLASNRYARAARNPVRLVFYPRDEYGYPVAVLDNLKITTNPTVDLIQQQRPDGQSGIIYLDIHHSQPQSSHIKLEVGGYQTSTTIYFAPNCQQRVGYCLQHPQQLWWFIRNWWGDHWRQWQERT